ncbi:MAG TPA: FRG domain-containing protein [Gallionellaceae bacterium]|nr:FRG domain-containing protein [Gallionellaceae bacterium]
MDEDVIDSVDQLKSYFNKYGAGFLFRGQTSHYQNSRNEPNIPTSFSRHGCIPPLMFKWTHYSKALIRAFGGGNYHDLDIGLSQAILQHYGWRSFFVDLTKTPQIACWFAANQYSENKTINMCEDFEENPVWLINKQAIYTESEERGHVYIIDPRYLINQNLKIHDLTEIAVDEGVTRFHSQSACLAEGRDGLLPYKSIVAHLQVNHRVLVDYYKEAGIKSTLDVFPNRENDFILRCLLNIPWYKIQSAEKFAIPAYRRSLEIPEYDSTYVKHLSPSVTLFNEFWISTDRYKEGSPFATIPFYKLPEHAYFSNTNDQFDLSKINKLIDEHTGFVIELDGLIKIPELDASYEYEKGIVVQKVENNIISVSGLIIEHPGHKVASFGANKGWLYKIEEGLWKKIDHSEQCPCNNNLRHELQFSLLRVLNESLKNNDIICEDPLNYYHKELKNSVAKR